MAQLSRYSLLGCSVNLLPGLISTVANYTCIATASGVAFVQSNSYSPTCFKYGVKGHTVNDCPKLDEAGKEKFWADRKSAQEAKRGVAHVVVADAAAATPAPAPAPSVASVPGSNTSQEFERFQR